MFSTGHSYRVPKEKKMFKTLRFNMENSIGTHVSVNLYNSDSLVDFEIQFPDLGVKNVQKQSLGCSGSAKLLDEIKKSGFIYFMTSFAERGAKEFDGDYWRLDFELEDGSHIHLQGPRPEESLLYPFIQDFAELLDKQFSMTQFISSSRVDKLEIHFLFNEFNPQYLDFDSQYDQFDHMETVTLDRSSFLFSYRKRFPASCFHSTYECKCEQQIRQILDQTTTALVDEHLFEDIVEQCPEHPMLLLCFTFHDGSTAKVRRSLSYECLRDQLYVELIDVLFETSLQLFYKGGILDKRFMLAKNGMETVPFSISYNEDCDESEV